MQTHRYFWDRNQRRIRSTNWSHLYPWFVPHSSLSTSSSLKSKKCPSEKYEKSTRSVQYIWPYCPLVVEACAADFFETRPKTSTQRRNRLCQIVSRSVQGLRSSDTPKLRFPIDLVRRSYNSVVLPWPWDTVKYFFLYFPFHQIPRKK